MRHSHERIPRYSARRAVTCTASTAQVLRGSHGDRRRTGYVFLVGPNDPSR